MGTPLDKIRSLYHPVQPAVRRIDDHIYYEEFMPGKDVQPYVYCYWQLKTTERLADPYSYRVVSDGCIDIFFETLEPANSFVMGFCRKYTEFEIGHQFNYSGIRFFPAAFTHLFGVEAKRISNQDLKLKQILPELASTLSGIKNLELDECSLTLQLDETLRAHIQQANTDIDTRFYDALTEILSRHGHVDVERELNTGLSPRQLRRIFNYYIGTTPKAFSNVVRFQYILNAKPSSQSLKENKIYYDVGFFDQAHFIKSFKSFYGVTPAQVFR